MIGQYSWGGTTLPVDSWIGSAMNAATVSGPSYWMTDSSIRAHATSHSGYVSRYGQWRQLGGATWRNPPMSGSKGVFRLAMPVALSAPKVTPWKLR